jgi:hypothetical protein
LQRKPHLKVEYYREFRHQQEKPEDEGHWWSLIRWENILLRSREPFNLQDEDNVRRILIEIESNPKIDEMIEELFRLDEEIYGQVNRFKTELKVIVDKLNDRQFKHILQGNCVVCR